MSLVAIHIKYPQNGAYKTVPYKEIWSSVPEIETHPSAVIFSVFLKRNTKFKLFQPSYILICTISYIKWKKLGLGTF